MATHFHFGYGVTGYGPEEPSTCPNLFCLRDCVYEVLSDITDSWVEQAHGQRSLLERLRKEHPASWEAVARAALGALECLDGAETTDMLRLNLRTERRDAPAYQGNPAAWEAELRRLLIDGSTYPLDTDPDGNHRFYVWECWQWRCLLSSHDAYYEAPGSCWDGGGVPCACRDCMELVYWSPTADMPPYCHACTDAGCSERIRGECEADSDA